MLGELVHRVRRRIAVKLTLTLVAFVAVTMAVAGVWLGRSFEAVAMDALEARLATAGRLLADEARELIGRRAPPETFRAFALRAAGPAQARVSVIAADGRVLADSEVGPEELARLENHAGRPEVAAALAGRTTRHLRRSATLDGTLLYVAVPVGERLVPVGVLRFAVPLAVIRAAHAEVRRLMIGGALVAVAVAFAIGVFVAGRVTRPVIQMQAVARRMSEGDFGVHAPVRSPDEIGALGRALNAMADRLRDKIRDLEDERAKATAILDAMVEGLVAVDAHHAVLLLNERARAMFALGDAAVTGRPFLEVVRNADLYEVLRECRSRADAVQRELALLAPVARRVQVNAVPLRLSPHDVGAVMVLHDITELRRLEQVRTEFVANVSHELRTPLTAIQGYLETLLGGAVEEPEHARRFLEIALRHTRRLGRLLEDLTDLSNIELGKVPLRLEPTDVAEVVESVLDIMRPRAAAGDVGLAAALPPGLPAVRADRDRLAQVLINLVDNAVKYTPPRGRVDISAVAREATVEIAVRDTGAGIPRAALPRITERFYRVDKARSRELGGTGLGLAIVKHLVLAHGGELRIESEEGRGTVVTFTVPREPAAPPGAR